MNQQPLHYMKEIGIMRITDEQARDADRVLRAQYFQSVRDMAEELAEMCRSGEIADTEALDERIHEECDWSEWVIYTARALQVLRYSENASAGPEELGGDRFNWSDGMHWSELAYWALRADLQEQLDAEGIDLNDPDEWREEEEEEEEDDE